jgi:hypothetical protein
MEHTYTAFVEHRLVASGHIHDVAIATFAVVRAGAQALVFQDRSGTVIDLDLRGTAQDVVARLDEHPLIAPPKRGRGRPKLGVTSREVSLLPRHWDWLKSQPKSASATLRLLVERSMKAENGKSRTRLAEHRAYGVMTVLAGDLPGFEEASRALFAHDLDRLRELAQAWPQDIATYVLRLVQPDDAGA